MEKVLARRPPEMGRAETNNEVTQRCEVVYKTIKILALPSLLIDGKPVQWHNLPTPRVKKRKKYELFGGQRC